MKHIKVEDRTDLVRDSHSKAIINIDSASYERRVNARNLKLKERSKLTKLENDVTEIKSVLNKILGKLEDNNGETSI
tara:strand:- start:196 stop:426 length:231 start_codon:yes stop_codon:yes gene_type:complete